MIRTIFLITAIIIFTLGVALQFICTLQHISLLCFGVSSLMFLLLKDKPIKKATNNCKGNCKNCACKINYDEQHNQT